MMEKLDRWSALFWLGISVAVCVHSVSLGVGSFREPGIGFLFFWGSAALGVLSLVLLSKTYLGQKKDRLEQQGSSLGGIRWSTVGAVTLALVTYALIFEPLGALLSTAIFMAFLMRAIEAKRWTIVVIVALVSALSIHVLFRVLLHVRLPAGFLGF
jgi:putative tricarboxylic transport membrane protein